MPWLLNAVSSDFQAKFEELLTNRQQCDESIRTVVASIIEHVQQRGDEAVLEYTRRFDNHSPHTTRVGDDEWSRALQQCDSRALEALKLAAERIEKFHRLQLPAALDHRDEQGLRLGVRWIPLASAGLYSPGGKASYPSSVLMSAIPAKVAGVRRLVMATPAPDGRLNPLVLASARLAGVDEIYRIGGAQAIAAMACGTVTVSAVDKIAGPGNRYVTEAKRQLLGKVGIDMLAGPSEVVIVASRGDAPEWIAADLLAQAEHDQAAQSILVTDDHLLAEQVIEEVERQLPDLSRREIAAQSWQDHGAVILLARLEQAPAVIDSIAPEHLQLVAAKAEPLIERISNAGAIFVGAFAPEALGDYVAGPNHILPTGGCARYASGLGVWDFMKRSTLIGCNARGLAQVGRYGVTLAKLEGLDAHARSLELRLNSICG